MGVHYLLVFRRTRGVESGISGTGGTIVGGRSCQIWIIGAISDPALSLSHRRSFLLRRPHPRLRSLSIPCIASSRDCALGTPVGYFLLLPCSFLHVAATSSQKVRAVSPFVFGESKQFDGAAKPSARNSSSVKVRTISSAAVSLALTLPEQQIHDRTTPFCWLPRHAHFSKPSSKFRLH